MRVIAFLLAFVFAVEVAFGDDLPDLGDVAQASFTPQQERALGESIMRQIREDRAYVDDPELVDYLNDLGYRLVSQSPEYRQEFEFFVVLDPSVNAFALPGGFIGVHTGLFLVAQSESEFASVLGHEIAHVTQRHIARMIAGQKQSTILSIAALAVAILAARGSPQLSQAAMVGAGAGAIQSQLNYTREHEREADRIGYQILERSGFDVNAMPVFFERLQRATRTYDSSAPSYLRTHPLTTERIADMRNRAEGAPYRLVADSVDFQLLRAKIRATSDTPKEAVAFFRESIGEQKFTNEAAARYGLTTALMRAQQYPEAKEELRQLRVMLPSNPIVETLTGRLLVASGDLPAALNFYRSALRAHPRYRALALDYAATLLQDKQAAEALKFLQEQVQIYPTDPHIYEMEARSYAALGQKLQQHRAQSESYFLLGNVPAAIDQLQLGLKAGDGDFYQLSSAEARLRELRAIEVEDKDKPR
ncbi:MAG TPA: M48 family metalloprotease [Burkholderiales bacterium]|nr:M48 family metallopeptidase [Betaproteobacteria bacterium]HQR53688.1 M48 family metalloprotease [Burkholderiales bacterium]